MASKSISIRDTWVALHPSDGSTPVIPGEFEENGTVFRFPRVTTVNTHGKQLHWEVAVRLVRIADKAVVPFNTQELLGQPVSQLDGFAAVVCTYSWQEGGKVRDGSKPTFVTQGKNIDKANATNMITQALRDALSLYNKQVKRAGVSLVGKHAASASQPMQWRPAPMLVNPLDKDRAARLTPEVLARGVTVQRKYNGVRLVACMTPSRVDGKSEPDTPSYPVTLYSRTGGDYLGMMSLRAALGIMLSVMPKAWESVCSEKGRDPWQTVVSHMKEKGGMAGLSAEAVKRSHPLLYIDGELYEHGRSLQYIQGQATGKTSGESLTMTVFDCFLPEMTACNIPITSATRQRLLDRVFALAKETTHGQLVEQKVRRADNFPLAIGDAAATAAIARIHELARGFLEAGYEGAIVRKDDAPYQYGTNNTHSSNLVKIKPKFDAEFPIVGYTEGSKGKDVGAVIWICEVPAGRSKTGKAEQFNVVPKNMKHPERVKIFQVLPRERPEGGTYFDAIRGLPMTVEFPELSAKTGIPVQAKALGIRNYEPTPGRPGMGTNPLAWLLGIPL